MDRGRAAGSGLPLELAGPERRGLRRAAESQQRLSGRSARAVLLPILMARARRLPPPTVGQVLGPSMAAHGWTGAERWIKSADRVAPALVGGSDRRGGADLGPTGSKKAWAALGVNGNSLGDEPPGRGLSRGRAAQADCRPGCDDPGDPSRLALHRWQDIQVPSNRPRDAAAAGNCRRTSIAAALRG